MGSFVMCWSKMSDSLRGLHLCTVIAIKSKNAGTYVHFEFNNLQW